MKAAFIHETGPASSIVYGDLPIPQAGPGQVLVKVAAVAVNPIDTYVRSGAVKMDLPKPFVVGCDLAGTVNAVGGGVTRFRPGERVWCSNQGLMGRQGTFAEYAAVGEEWLYPLPDGVEEKCAAAVALVGLTAHLGLFNRAKLQAGESLFVNGGTGGIGSMVVQMGKAVGARVMTTAGSDEKVAACLELGADAAVNYRTANVAEQIRAFAPNGVDVYWETRREPDFDQAISLLAKRGRMILMAGRDARPTFPVGPFYVKDCSLLGLAMFNASPEEQRRAAEDINRWLATGKLKSRIDRVLPLAETAAAHQLQEDNTLKQTGTLAGKIVLVP